MEHNIFAEVGFAKLLIPFQKFKQTYRSLLCPTNS